MTPLAGAGAGAAGRADDKAVALKLVPLSVPIVERLEIYAAMLHRWQRVENLVSPASLDYLWTRHFADCAQLLDLAPRARHWADLGSGAGLPGLVLAIIIAERPGAAVHLIESNQRKCAFLRQVSRETSVPAIIHAGRIEAVVPGLEGIEVVTARALAPLDALLSYAAPLLKKGAIGLFPKGAGVAAELTRLGGFDTYAVTLAASKTDSSGRIVVVRPTPPPLPDAPGAGRAR